MRRRRGVTAILVTVAFTGVVAVALILVVNASRGSVTPRTSAGITYGVFDEPTVSDDVLYRVVFRVDSAGCLTGTRPESGREYFVAIPKVGSVSAAGVDLGEGATVPFGTVVGVGRTGDPDWDQAIAPDVLTRCGRDYELFAVH